MFWRKSGSLKNCFACLMRRCVANSCIDQSRMSEPAISSWLTLTTTNNILYSFRENKLFQSTLNGVRGCTKNMFQLNYFQKYQIKNVFVICFKTILSMRADNYLSARLDFYMKILFGFIQCIFFGRCQEEEVGNLTSRSGGLIQIHPK